MSFGEKVALAIYFVGVAGSVVFVARRLASRWWRYPEGIALLLQHLMLVGFGASALVALTLNQDYPGRVVITIALMAGFSGSVWWLTYLQEQARRQHRRQPAAHGPAAASEVPPANGRPPASTP